jgi:hypothetical protein
MIEMGSMMAGSHSATECAVKGHLYLKEIETVQEIIGRHGVLKADSITARTAKHELEN